MRDPADKATCTTWRDPADKATRPRARRARGSVTPRKIPDKGLPAGDRSLPEVNMDL